MATKFSVWIDTPSTSTDGNMQSYTDFAADSQRKAGFASGTPASSVRVNTALREATLFATGFMKAFLDDSTLDATATVAQLLRWRVRFKERLQRKSMLMILLRVL